MTTIPGIEAIALVGGKNQRLYLNARVRYQQQAAPQTQQQKVGNELLRLEYAAHCALDVIEERSLVRNANGELTPAAVSFLGLVLTLEDLAIYAMVTSTKLRIMLLITPGEFKVKDLDCLTVLRAVHTCYLSYISNPFHALPSPNTGLSFMNFGQSNAHVDIKSDLFDKRIKAIGGW